MLSQLLLCEARVLLLIANVTRHAMAIIRFDEVLQLLDSELHYRSILHNSFGGNSWCAPMRILAHVYLFKNFTIQVIQHWIWLSSQIFAVRTVWRLQSHDRARTLTQLQRLQSILLIFQLNLAWFAEYLFAFLAFERLDWGQATSIACDVTLELCGHATSFFNGHLWLGSWGHQCINQVFRDYKVGILLFGDHQVLVRMFSGNFLIAFYNNSLLIVFHFWLIYNMDFLFVRVCLWLVVGIPRRIRQVWHHCLIVRGVDECHRTDRSATHQLVSLRLILKINIEIIIVVRVETESLVRCLDFVHHWLDVVASF